MIKGYKIENAIWIIFSVLMFIGCIFRISEDEISKGNIVMFASLATMNLIVFFKNLKEFVIKKQAYVICCNDAVKYVVVDSKAGAELILDELCQKDYVMHQKYNHQFKSFEEYKHIMLWRIEEVEYE